MSDYMIPGLAVGISRKGEHIWVDAFGKADIENDVPTHRDSVWRMASISKAWGSGLIGWLMDKGMVELHRPIYDYLDASVFPIKQWKERDVNITLSQLMSHTSGLRVDNEEEYYKTFISYKNITESIARFIDDPLISEPGTEYHYSNYGWQVVGAIVEAVMDESYDKVINKFFKHLTMNSTFCEKHEMIVKNRVRDYMRSDSTYGSKSVSKKKFNTKSNIQLVNALPFDSMLDFEAQWASGGILSSTDDLLSYGDFMLNSYKGGQNESNSYQYLSSSTVKQLWTPIMNSSEQVTKDSLEYSTNGWFLTQFKSPTKISKAIWKTGHLSGLCVIIMILPEQQMVVTLFANTYDFDNVFPSALIIAENFMN